VNSGPVTINGHTYNTIEDYITYLASSSISIEGSEFITISGAGTAADPYIVTITGGDPNSMLITNAAGEVEWISIEDIVRANETITTLADNGDGTYTYTSEDGTVTVIDVPASVVENFETIVNSGPVTINGHTYNTIEDYITYLASSSISIEGSEFITISGAGTAADPYIVTIKGGDPNSMLITNAAGEVEWISIEDIVRANETITTLVDNGDGTYTYTSEDGTVTVIDVPASVVEHFDTIINSGPVTIDGHTYNTIDEYI